jgi:hypothetical protein
MKKTQGILDVCAVDIKSLGANVTSMAYYNTSNEAYRVIDQSWAFLESHFPVETVNALRSLAVKSS